MRFDKIDIRTLADKTKRLPKRLRKKRKTELLLNAQGLTIGENKLLVRMKMTISSYDHILKYDKDKTAYFYINADEIRKFLGHDYLKPLEELIQKGYIVRPGNKDQHGNVSLQLQIGDRLKETKMVKISKKALYENDEKGYNNFNKAMNIHYAKVHSSDRYLNNALAIDHIAKALMSSKLNLTEQQVRSLYYKKYDERDHPISRYQYVMLGTQAYYRIKEMENIGNLEELKALITISAFGQRLYHPILSVIKELRGHILIDGEETVSIDIKNSQPVFLALALKEKMGSEQLMDIFKGKGDIYSMLAKEMNKTRSEAKITFFINIFGPYTTNNKHFKKVLGWKTLDAISVLKFTKVDSTIKKWYANLVFILQTIESKYTIRGMSLLASKKKIKFIPIHDEFIVKKSDLKAMLRLLKRAANILDPKKDLIQMLEFKVA